MTAQYFSGSFLTKTSTGNLAVTGVGFTPTLVIFFSWGKTNTLAATADAGMCFGAATSPTARWSVSRHGKDNQATDISTSTNIATKCLSYSENTGLIFECDFVSFDADGFTVNFTTAAAAARDVFYIAVNGITAKCGTISTALATGNQAITGVGFQPTFVFFKGENTAGATGHDDFGAALSSSSRWYMNNYQTSTNPSSGQSMYGSGKCYTKWGNGSAQYEADFVSMNADGFTINSTTNNGFAQTVNYIAIKDISVALGNVLSGATSADIVVSGLGFAPGGLILIGSSYTNTVLENTQTLGTGRSVGMASSPTLRNWFTYQNVNNVSPSVNKCNGGLDGVGTALSNAGTVVQKLDLKSFDVDGFTLSLSTTDNVSRRYYYAALQGVFAVSAKGATLPLMGVG